MNDDYLWDGSGQPDPEIQRLERSLRPFRLDPGATPLRRRAPQSPAWRWAAAAAAVLLPAVWLMRVSLAPTAATAWQVSAMAGTARLGSREARPEMPIRSGEILRTGGSSQVTLEADAVGRIDLGANSELRAANSTNVLLRRGTLHAFIWAPPRDFVVDTPSARAVDLGCEYTLEVDPRGEGLLRVSMGWVAFQFNGNESFIPAGAQCVTRPRSGPGIPFYQDASPQFRDALSRYEAGDGTALSAVLDAARPRDALSLWHLLTRAAPSARGAVFDRFAGLATLPSEVTREAAIHSDPHTIDLCWNALNLEDTGWWRGWERVWK